MNETAERLAGLLHRVPRRHTAENVKEIYSIVDDYEELLKGVEADPQYEQQVAPFFDALYDIRETIKKSNDNKLSKKGKDVLFDEASGMLKDALEELKELMSE